MANWTKEKINGVLEALKKNEYGQYIVSGFNQSEKAIIWANTENPCSRDNQFACLECPYDDCIAPCYITTKGDANCGDYHDGIRGAYEPAHIGRINIAGGHSNSRSAMAKTRSYLMDL